jgi:hypothetical protein
VSEPCPICGLPATDFVEAGQPNCIIRGGDRCYRRGFERLQARLVVADRVAAAARSVKVSIETGKQQALAAELLDALMEYDAAALLREHG